MKQAADWDACVTGGGCNGYKPKGRWGRVQQPVTNVNWEDVQAYVAWLSFVTGKTYRLPTEAEYEYAARGGTQTKYPWGDDIMLNGKTMANCRVCGSQWDYKKTAPVGSFAPNKFGLYDMVGNVSLWTEDCFHPNYEGAPADGSVWIKGGDCTSRILRGISYWDDPDDTRSEWDIVTRDVDIGFRVARTLDTR
jgi:formylglycine-generating enzyme required for sulfatase activity